MMTGPISKERLLRDASWEAMRPARAPDGDSGDGGRVLSIMA